jgi:hypothetical protein
LQGKLARVLGEGAGKAGQEGGDIHKLANGPQPCTL